MNVPKCPNCGEELNSVDWKIYEYYDWTPDGYKRDDYATNGEIRCLNCDYSLADVFPNGPEYYEGE